ncbi:Bro-N domain-containing protein [Polaromonas sp.]|uniref:BRO-N domain-containing protein n=1 Tax=Polaromonas sp. TaxID=1869339 RepID=UPI003BB7DF2C
MNPLAPFEFENNAISVFTDVAGNPWFNAYQLCNVLGFGNARQALASHVDTEDVQKLDTLTQGGKQSTNYVNESGMYALIFGSTKPEAKRFKHWVTSEVLPAIRKTGSYSPSDIFAAKRMQRFSQQRSLPRLDRYQNREVNQKAAAMGRQMADICRDYLIWELAGTDQDNGEFQPDSVNDHELHALMYYASVEDVLAYAQARENARRQANFQSLRG